MTYGANPLDNLGHPGRISASLDGATLGALQRHALQRTVTVDGKARQMTANDLAAEILHAWASRQAPHASLDAELEDQDWDEAAMRWRHV